MSDPLAADGDAPDSHVDVVYTWAGPADGNRMERMRAEHARYSAEDPKAYPPSPPPSELDELRYSIRSLGAAFPDFRRLIVVVQDTPPAWLKLAHPRVTVINHAALFEDPSDLPTYNSQAIESYLHRIPGLAERFLYLNDDFFVDGPFRLADFFDARGRPGVPLGRALSPTGPVRPRDAADTAAHRNANRVLNRVYGRRLRLTVRHQPRPLTRSLLTDCARVFPEAFRVTRACRFRSRRMVAIHNCLLPFWACYEGRAFQIPPRFTEKDMYVWGNDAAANKRIKERVERSSARAFCIQSSGSGVTPAAADAFRAWMDQRYAEQSVFEV